MLKKLNRSTANIDAKRPVKVLQFGEGNFLRAFTDWAIDILNEKTDFNGNIQIIQPIAQGMADQINEQGGLYHVILNGIENGKPTRTIRLIDSVAGVLNPYLDYNDFLKTSENESLEFIISNTTEAGIAFEESDTPETLPGSFPGKLTALLYHRFKHFNGDPAKALIIIPCELIDKNGSKLKETILQYANHWNLPDEFKTWIEVHTTFCNTLVDRIVPGFPKETIGEIQRELGYTDNLVVTAEPFHLWVIEGPEHVANRFPTAKAGLDVKFVADQTPYRTRKVRILNGAHTALVPVAYLKGLRTVKESVENESIRAFLTQTIFEEIIPTLDLPKDELDAFANSVLERFANPYIRHELISISLNSISKFKVRVLPSLLGYIQEKGKLPVNLVESLAALILFYKGEYKGETIPLSDTEEVLGFMKLAWKDNDPDNAVAKILSNKKFWDQDLSMIKGLKELILNVIEEKF